MTNQHPITPPPELVQQWLGEFFNCTFNSELSSSELFLTTRAAQWAADQELEACSEWVSKYLPYLGDFPMPEDKLRAARRPKPPSLKEQALEALMTADGPDHPTPMLYLRPEAASIIRRALEQLPE